MIDVNSPKLDKQSSEALSNELTSEMKAAVICENEKRMRLLELSIHVVSFSVIVSPMLGKQYRRFST
jgi:hypothetical protein